MTSLQNKTLYATLNCPENDILYLHVDVFDQKTTKNIY